MPLSKLVFKPGINRDQTNYASEGGWYACDKIRFRSGFPEKIGGWVRYSNESFLGVCRSMFNWITSDGNNLLGLGTNKKEYVEATGYLYDITPVRLIFINEGITGVTAAGAVGNVSIAINQVPVSGVSAQVFLDGSNGVNVYAAARISPTGSSATAQVGTVLVLIQ